MFKMDVPGMGVEKTRRSSTRTPILRVAMAGQELLPAGDWRKWGNLFVPLTTMHEDFAGP
jgi:hypothetical protein